MLRDSGQESESNVRNTNGFCEELDYNKVKLLNSILDSETVKHRSSIPNSQQGFANYLVIQFVNATAEIFKE